MEWWKKTAQRIIAIRAEKEVARKLIKGSRSSSMNIWWIFKRFIIDRNNVSMFTTSYFEWTETAQPVLIFEFSNDLKIH